MGVADFAVSVGFRIEWSSLQWGRAPNGIEVEAAAFVPASRASLPSISLSFSLSCLGFLPPSSIQSVSLSISFSSRENP